MLVEQARLSQHKGSSTGGAQRRSVECPLSKRLRSITDVRPNQSRFQSIGYLTRDRRNNDIFGRSSSSRLNWDPQSVCGSNRLSHTYDLDFELWNSESSHLTQFICGLQCIQNGRQA